MMGLTSSIYGISTRRDPETVKRDGWREMGIHRLDDLVGAHWGVRKKRN